MYNPRPMLKQDLLDYYGRPTDVARGVGVSDATVHRWNIVVPYLSAVRAEERSNREVRLIPSLYDERGNPLKGRALSAMLRQLRRTRRSAVPRRTNARASP